jgi:basic membrane protein A
MKKQAMWLITLLIILTMVAACASQPTSEPAGVDIDEVAPVTSAENSSGVVVESETTLDSDETAAGEIEGAVVQGEAQVQPVDESVDATVAQVNSTPGKYGLVAGPIDDRGFNQLAWEGMQRAVNELGIEVVRSEAQEGGDYAANVTEVLREGVNGVVVVGAGLAQVTRAASQANPDIPFISIDFPSQTATDLGVIFSTDEPAFMAGYLAASMSQSGVVCTFGGAQTPPVLSFMVGFEHGVMYYNQKNNGNVNFLGWKTDPANQLAGEGLFVDSFTDTDAGRQAASQLFDQGCDIIFPVAGGAGLGAAAVAQERGLKVIGVDADQVQANPEYANVFLTSVLKRIDEVVFAAIRLVETGEFEQVADTFRNNYVGSLENNGVGLAPFYNYDGQIPLQIKADLDEMRLQLIEGSLRSGWPIVSGANMEAVSPMPPPPPAAAPAPSASSGAPNSGMMTLDALRNAEYQVEYTASGTAKLANGEYREPAAPGSATEIVVKLSEKIAFGDLTGDGVDEAAVILISDPGGSGTFYDLAVMTDQGGVPVQLASVVLGDRVKVNSLTIQAGEVVVDMVTQGPNDAMPNPTENVIKRYRLEVQLVEQGGDAVSVAPAGASQNFSGTYSASMPAASGPGRQVVLTLNADGSAEFSTDFQNGKPPIVEVGTWQDNGDGTAMLTLTGRADGTPYMTPDVITFGLQGNELRAIAWDQNVYGSEGLSLTKQ